MAKRLPKKRAATERKMAAMRSGLPMFGQNFCANIMPCAVHRAVPHADIRAVFGAENGSVAETN